MKTSILKLKQDAAHIRLGVLKSLQHLGAGHIGGSMSMAEVMAVLYGEAMNLRPDEPRWPQRDWLVVSKGHCGPAVYATLALHGFFPQDALTTMNTGGTMLPSHCDRNLTPGIDMSTGSLGQGMSTALGVAMGNRAQNHGSTTYLILGDGEMQEGQVWEGALFAAQQKLSNLVAFVDFNQKQLDGYTADICNLGDLAQKFRDFGWYAIDCAGNDVESVYSAIQLAKAENERPSLVVLHTEKGIGCSFAEGVLYNHHVKFTAEEWAQATHRLTAELEALERQEG